MNAIPSSQLQQVVTPNSLSNRTVLPIVKSVPLSTLQHLPTLNMPPLVSNAGDSSPPKVTSPMSETTLTPPDSPSRLEDLDDEPLIRSRDLKPSLNLPDNIMSSPTSPTKLRVMPQSPSKVKLISLPTSANISSVSSLKSFQEPGNSQPKVIYQTLPQVSNFMGSSPTRVELPRTSPTKVSLTPKVPTTQPPVMRIVNDRTMQLSDSQNSRLLPSDSNASKTQVIIIYFPYVT